MQDDLGVRGRLADGARGDELAAQRQRVGQIAVVSNGKSAGVEIGEQGLHVAQHGIAGGGVAIMAERDVALEPPDHVGFVEVVADEAQAALGVELARRRTRRCRRPPVPMLQGVKAERGQGRSVLMPEHAETPRIPRAGVVLVRSESPEQHPVRWNRHAGLKRARHAPRSRAQATRRAELTWI